MKIPSTTTAGLALASGTAAISGVAVFVNGLVVASFPDPVARSTSSPSPGRRGFSLLTRT